jgi:hypothetical protein
MYKENGNTHHKRRSVTMRRDNKCRIKQVAPHSSVLSNITPSTQ